ncbi:hypothetical protein E3G52_000371 [Mycobacteroides abscessus]|uniref:hypothetical protein n=1 Tax=Mycobacteroides abscessus TaxID=36809 RepID=UPI001878547B|nr:hypothetical protein [Mycobacteroides abscessus]MBE5453507.1 hypothetical protein [Mycobacteroides abscessus]
MSTSAARKSSPRKAAAKKAAPKVDDAPVEVETKEAPAPAGAPSPYPADTPVYEYETEGGYVVKFPKYSAIQPPTREFWWALYQLDEMFQAFEWMDWAGVPKDIQAHVVALPDNEYKAVFDQWFADSKLTAGE